MVAKHIANKLVTTVTLLYIRYHTLHCTLRREVLLMQNVSRRFTEKCNALRNEMQVYEMYSNIAKANHNKADPPAVSLRVFSVKSGHYYTSCKLEN